MRKSLFCWAAVSVALIAAPAVASTDFVGDYDVSLNVSDPGLVVAYQPIASDANGLNFTLNEGQTTTIGLFKLYTMESAVNLEDDLASKPINVGFSFTVPEVFGGSVSGTTQGTGLVFFGAVVLDAGSPGPTAGRRSSISATVASCWSTWTTRPSMPVSWTSSQGPRRAP